MPAAPQGGADAAAGRTDRIRRVSAAAIAATAWGAVVVDGVTGIAASMAEGRGFSEALFLFLRFFTILTIIGTALVMSATVLRPLRPPHPAAYAGTTIYLIVVGGTYEALLRRLWTPHGVQIVTDIAMHDIVPSLTVVFWLAVAPKHGLRWRHVALWLAYPLAYFILTLAAGRLGIPYPYGFLDAGKLGPAALARNVAGFLLVFASLGAAFVLYARAATRGTTRRP